MSTITEEERQKAIRSILNKREYNRSYSLGHRKERRNYNRQYYQAHQEELQAQTRQYKQERRAEVKEYNRRYYLEHRAELIAQTELYWHKHPEKKAEHDRLYRQRHPEVHRDSNRRREARQRGVKGSFTSDEFIALCKAFGNRCTYCGAELMLVPDHAIPLSRGGANSIDNILPACSFCNNQKSDKTYEEYVEWLHAEVI